MSDNTRYPCIYADSIDENAVHGSDAVESAAREIAYFFADEELCPRTR